MDDLINSLNNLGITLKKKETKLVRFKEENIKKRKIDIKKEIIYKNAFLDWMKNNPNHTFPKKKKKWLKLIETHRFLKNPKRYFNPVRTLKKIIFDNYNLSSELLYFKSNFLYYWKKNYKELNETNFFKFIKDVRFKFVITYNEDTESIYQILLRNRIIIIENKKPIINNYIFHFNKPAFKKINEQEEINNCIFHFNKPIKRKINEVENSKDELVINYFKRNCKK